MLSTEDSINFAIIVYTQSKQGFILKLMLSTEDIITFCYHSIHTQSKQGSIVRLTTSQMIIATFSMHQHHVVDRCKNLTQCLCDSLISSEISATCF